MHFRSENSCVDTSSIASSKCKCTKRYIILGVLFLFCIFRFGMVDDFPSFSQFVGYLKHKVGLTPRIEAQVPQKEVSFQQLIERYRPIAYQVEATLLEHIIPDAHAAAKPKKPIRGNNKVGVYLTAPSAGNDTFLEETMDRLKAAGGSAFVFDVKGPFVYFQSNAQMANELNMVRPFYDLPEIIAKAKERNLYTIARFVASKDAIFASRKPEVLIRHPQTNIAPGYEWVDLSHPDVLAYNRQILKEIVVSGVDEINLDYIRYPTEYAQWRIGLTGSQKAYRIEKFVRMARKVIDRYGPDTKLGISTYAILGWNYKVNLEPLGQDVVRFAPYVDIISPMAYPSTFANGAYFNPAINPRSRMYYLVYKTLMGYREILGEEHEKKLRPWIQGYYVTNQDMRDQMDAVFDAGSCGFTVWSAGNYYDVPYKVLPDIKIPKWCRK